MALKLRVIVRSAMVTPFGNSIPPFWTNIIVATVQFFAANSNVKDGIYCPNDKAFELMDDDNF